MEKETSSTDVKNSPKKSCLDVKEPVAKDTSSAISQLSQIMITEENSEPQIMEENKEAVDINNKGIFLLKDKLIKKETVDNSCPLDDLLVQKL